MLDVLFPIPTFNAELAPQALEQLERRTDVPVRVLAVVDGGLRSDFAQVESFLKGCSMEWMLLHEEAPVYLNGCIRAALPHVKNPFVAFMQPQVVLADDRWFGKMQQVLLKDQLAGVVDTVPNTGSSALLPVRRSVHKPPIELCPLALLTRRSFTGFGAPPGAEWPVDWWFRQSLSCGGTAWHAGGVAYSILQHVPHIAWRAPSAAPALSESRSPTTPGSSTRTTTGKAGFEAFEL